MRWTLSTRMLWNVPDSPERNELLRKIKNCEDVNDVKKQRHQMQPTMERGSLCFEGKLQMVFRVAKFDKGGKLRTRRSAAN